MRNSFMKSSSPNPNSPKLQSNCKPRGHKPHMSSKVISPNQQRARSPRGRSPLRGGSPNGGPRMSAFNRINSKTLLSQLVLPGFLRVNQDEIKKFTSLDNFCRLGTSDSTFNESRMYSRVKLSVLESSKLSGGYNDISQLIFDRNMPSEEILINVGKLSLKREDLHCMQKGLDLNEQVVDVILKLIKRKNKKLIKKGKVKKSIFCLSSDFSAQLFKEGAVVPQKYQKNLLEYDFLIFPAKFNSWTLAVLETRAKMIKFYDPVGINDEKSLVLTQISKFVSSQLKTFAKVEISKTRWANLQIEKIDESEVFPDHDCGIYLFRRVHKYAAQHNKPIHPEALPVYRKRLMEYMFKHSN